MDGISVTDYEAMRMDYLKARAAQLGSLRDDDDRPRSRPKVRKGHHCVAIEQLEGGRVVMVFPSLKDAAASVGAASSSICNSITRGSHCAGYRWRRKGR